MARNLPQSQALLSGFKLEAGTGSAFLTANYRTPLSVVTHASTARFFQKTCRDV